MFIVFNIGIRLLVTTICTSIAVLLYTQLHKDAASRPYRALLTIIALFSFSAAVTRITGLLGITELVDVTFKISTHWNWHAAGVTGLDHVPSRSTK